jgi:hypothetical protein
MTGIIKSKKQQPVRTREDEAKRQGDKEGHRKWRASLPSITIRGIGAHHTDPDPV